MSGLCFETLPRDRASQPAVAAVSAVGRASRSLWTLQLNGNTLDRLAVSIDISLQQFLACESACIPLLGTGTPSLADLQECAARTEFLLWGLFGKDPVTAAFWTDGIEAESVTRAEEGLAMLGMLWCADHRDQWRVPIRAEFAFSQAQAPHLQRVHMLIADGAHGTLRQPSVRHFREPEHWLCQFQVHRPQPLAPSPEPALSAVRAWLDANPSGKIVDREWHTLTLEAAQSLISERSAAGIAVAIRSSWLDGGDVLQLDQSPE